MKSPRGASLAKAMWCALGISVAGFGQPAPARLINISTNGQVGTDANNMVGGFVIGGAAKTVLIRAIGPGLGAFGVPNTLPDPFLTLFDSASKVIGTNDNWSGADLVTMTSVGAFPLPANSKDAVIVTTLQPGAYTAQISGLGAAPTGAAILEVYDVSGGGQLINIATRLPVGTGANSATAGFVVNPGSGTRKLLVRGIGPGLGAFGLPGTLPDPKIVLYDSKVNVVASSVANGSVTALTAATAQAGAFAAVAGDAATIVTVSPGTYTVNLSSNSNSAGGIGIIEVYDITNSTGTPANLAADTPTLYYAPLRPAAVATNSMASGYATILFDPNTHVASVSVSFTNLTTATTSAHLVLESAGSGKFVMNLPRTQANGLPWTFAAVGNLSSTDLINALQNGQLFVSIDSANFPSGELQGNFIRTTGSTTFTAPAGPAALLANALTSPTQTDAARFLTQATFGPTTATIATLQARGITGWIDDQLALPATGALAALRADLAAFPNPPDPVPGNAARFAWPNNWNGVWWKIAATAPDQLRQRVAFALSEILVVGRQDNIEFHFESTARYYDLLINRAFGNYRQLLEDVSLSPTMGVWLSHIHNFKADPVKGTAPDENYAREIQQLFSIGLVQLQPDGTLLLDGAGQPIPAYDQVTVSETAKVFTGWTFASYPDSLTDENNFKRDNPAESTNYPAPLSDTSGWFSPMRCYDAFHDKTAKRVVSLQQVPLPNATPTPILANQTGPQDLKMLLDTLFNHPNTGPFFCRQLIQRLVTSNPSPGYVYRVAQKFANDGTGTRGNLGAVVRAILTDYEARSPDVLNNFGYGKIKEPVLRFTAVLRGLNFAAPNGRFLDGWFGDPRDKPYGYFPQTQMGAPFLYLGQAAMQSRSVFNFFSPTYSPPGAMAAAGLLAPEMELVDSNFGIQTPNMMTNLLYRTTASLPAFAPSPSPFLAADFSAFLPNARNAGALLDQLNLLFCANQMTAGTRTQVLAALTAMPAAASDLERVQTAIQFVITSPDGALQK